MIIKLTIDTTKDIMTQVKSQLPKPTYIIIANDVGSTSIRPRIVNGITEYPFTPLGKVLSNDIGKLCKKIKGHWYVENTEQFEKRVMS